MTNDTIVKRLIAYKNCDAVEPSFTFVAPNSSEAEHVSYGELYSRSLNLAKQLRQVCPKGERAILLYPAGLDFVIGFYACLLAGVISIPAALPRKKGNLEKLEGIIEDAGVKLILTATTIPDGSKSLLEEKAKEMDVVYTDTSEIPIKTRFYQSSPKLDDVAYLQYTSGSTGVPKGIKITHRNIVGCMSMMCEAMQIGPQSKWGGWLPHFHDMGLCMGILLPVYIGAPSVLMNPTTFVQKPIRWLRMITDYRCTHTGGPNFGFDLCVSKISKEDVSELDLSSLVVAMNGAEPVRESTLHQFTEKFSSVGFKHTVHYPCYGLAESTLMVSGGEVGRGPVIVKLDGELLEGGIAKTVVNGVKSNALSVRTGIGVGYSWCDHLLTIVNPETNETMPEGSVGEIWLKGISAAGGYWNREELSKEVFAATTIDTNEGPYLRTGDLGYYLDGQLFIAGRIKDVVIIRGANHYPQDIEVTVMNSHPALEGDATAAFSIERNQEEVLVVVQEIKRTHLRKLNVNEVLNAIRGSVAEHHDILIKDIVLIKPARIHKTTSGKIQRQTNKKSYLNDSFEPIARLLDQDSKRSTEDDGQSVRSTNTIPIRAWMIDRLCSNYSVDRETIDTSLSFQQIGLDSVSLTMFTQELSAHLETKISSTIAYDYPSIDLLANHLTQKFGGTAVPAITESRNSKDVAIVGMSCYFPGAKDVDEFWKNLSTGHCSIGQYPSDRANFDSAEYGAKFAGYCDGLNYFDNQFFNITPAEARAMDPQQRMLLELSYTALHDSGQTICDVAGSNTGVFIGISQMEYARLTMDTSELSSRFFATGTSLSIAANRLSYFFDLKGPSYSIDTACSSSLVAVHQAVRSIRDGECEQAIVGASNAILSTGVSQCLFEAGMLSADGKCKVFDADASGYVRGEGAGVVVLQDLELAKKSGRRILAIIRGSAVVQDGKSNGLTAPNSLSQQAVIRSALSDAGVNAADVNYVEAHGTGTELGDPIEVNSNKNYSKLAASPNPKANKGSVVK